MFSYNLITMCDSILGIGNDISFLLKKDHLKFSSHMKDEFKLFFLILLVYCMFPKIDLI